MSEHLGVCKKCGRKLEDENGEDYGVGYGECIYGCNLPWWYPASPSIASFDRHANTSRGWDAQSGNG
jgi:hypothetical protein